MTVCLACWQWNVSSHLTSTRNFAAGGILDSQVTSQQFVDKLYNVEDGEILQLPPTTLLN